GDSPSRGKLRAYIRADWTSKGTSNQTGPDGFLIDVLNASPIDQWNASFSICSDHKSYRVLVQ
ncbi:MAG: hypothetical protein ACWGQW_13530, partial [bacterium]